MPAETVRIALLFVAISLGTIIGIAATLFWHDWRSKRFRAQYEMPDIIGAWRCQWFDDSLDQTDPKVIDTVEIQKWTTNGQFLARGYQPQFHLAYPLMGEIDPSRVVTLIYRAARYPYEPNRGVVCMELSRDGRTMDGRWFGRRFSNRLGGGKVTFERMVQSGNVA